MKEFFIYFNTDGTDILDFFNSGEDAQETARNEWQRMTKHEKNRHGSYGAYFLELSESEEDLLNNADEDTATAFIVRHKPEWKTLYKPE